jgi:hypothetical protein
MKKTIFVLALLCAATLAFAQFGETSSGGVISGDLFARFSAETGHNVGYSLVHGIKAIQLGGGIGYNYPVVPVVLAPGGYVSAAISPAILAGATSDDEDHDYVGSLDLEGRVNNRFNLGILEAYPFYAIDVMLIWGAGEELNCTVNQGLGLLAAFSSISVEYAYVWPFPGETGLKFHRISVGYHF